MLDAQLQAEFAQIDEDGDQDLCNQLGGFYPDDKFRNALFLNSGTSSNGFLSLELTGTKSNTDAIGARITLVSDNWNRSNAGDDRE
ncbi:MAG: hypothetical protein O3C21_19870 [Verrucomicrobia bacterium]|nr:hypothetical protein [Verrucomicrobiota bacterium]